MIETASSLARRRKLELFQLEEDPLWYKDALIYEVHVRAFMDSDADGSGDFRGLVQKLPYLQDLGVNAIWLLPFYPSPLRDDGYDIADYNSVNPMYGTLSDAAQFLREAHRGTSTSGAKQTRNTRTPGSSSKTRRLPTGPGITLPTLTSGTGSIPISRT